MKTKNNVQKAVLRSAAVVVTFILLSFTVAAQGFWKQLLTHSSFNEIALALAENTAKTKAPGSNLPDARFIADAEINPAEEKRLEMEPWMADNNYFSAKPVFHTVRPMEPVLVLENWMLDESRFNQAHATEKNLELEPWMLDVQYFAD